MLPTAHDRRLRLALARPTAGGLARMSFDPAAERWRRARALFEALVDVAPEQRAAQLDAACRDDPALRDEVQSLLAADAGDAQTAPLHQRARAVIDDWVSAQLAAEHQALIGQQVGPWRVERSLGAGGMGTVYLGRRCDSDFEQRVAIKLVRGPLLQHEDLVRRFHDERRILAQLDHPYIARLLDGGKLADGTPYLVMEYVEGERIDRYCQRHALDLAARIELFCKVCRAVQAAHRALVVHRDLKPDNILIDTHGEPKLLDFGIARVLGDLDHTQTHADQRLFTPAYAAPEQFDGQVSTATDVYALGVVLYELLASVSPYGEALADTLKLLAAIRGGEEPAPPSRAAPSQVSIDRDLDAIVLKALRKSPPQRYGSVDALLDDLERHAARLPVRAREGNRAYIIGKFVNRHRWSLAFASLLLLAGSAMALNWRWQRDATMRERDKAQQVTRFLGDLLGEADPYRNLGKPVSVEELVERSVHQLQSDRSTPVELNAELSAVLANVLHRLGAYERASQVVAMAIERLHEEAEVDDPGLLPRLRLQRAASNAELGHAAAARAEYSALANELAGAPQLSGLRVRALGGLAGVHRAADRLADAARDSDAALRAAMDLLGVTQLDQVDPRRLTASDFELLASVLQEHCHVRVLQDPARALPGCRRSLALNERRHGPTHPRLLPLLNLIGMAHDSLGDLQASRGILERALALQLEVFGTDHPNVGKLRINLGVTLRSLGLLDAAEREYREATRILAKSLGDQHPTYLVARNNLGNLLYQRGRYQDALDLHEEVASARQALLPPTHRDIAQSLHNVAKCRFRLGQYAEARSAVAQALAVYAAGESSRDYSFKTRLLSALLEVPTRPDAALRDADRLQQELDDDHVVDNSAAVQFLRAQALRRLGRMPEAEAAARLALERCQRDLARDFASPEEIRTWQAQGGH